MKKLLILILLLSLPLVLAQEEPSPEEMIAMMNSPEFEQMKQPLIESTNKQLEEVPGPIKFMIGKNEKINLDMQNEIFGFEIEDGKIKDIIEKGFEEPTIDVKIDDSFFQEEIHPLDAFNQGKIQIKPQGFFKKIKFGIMKVVIKVIGKFIK